MNAVVLGIDPGLNGAIAVMRGSETSVVDMPTVEKKVGGKVKRRVDVQGLDRIIFHATSVRGRTMAFVELAQCSTQMGVSSSFNYGYMAGAIAGVLEAHNIVTCYVTPQKWKREMGLVVPGSRELGRNECVDKDRSIKLARKLYPALHAELNLAKHEGRAEAVLIAHWGCEQIDPSGAAPGGTCTQCGCTDDHACEGGCSWANAEHTLCSRCA